MFIRRCIFDRNSWFPIQSNSINTSESRLTMRDTICKCIYRHLIDEPITWTSIITDFLMSSTIAIIGLVTNFRFRKKLQQERKATLPGRKGNVIEPIMRWYLIFAMIFWPYELLYLWINAHEIMPSSWFENCWLMNTMMHPIRIGRTIIAYNSFFIALIRYIYTSFILKEHSNGISVKQVQSSKWPAFWFHWAWKWQES